MYSTLAKILEIEETPSSTTLISLTRKGLPKQVFNNLVGALEVSIQDITRLLPTSLRTLQRHQDKQALNKRTSDRIIQIAKVFNRAVEVFGTEQRAAKWLKAPILALGNDPPLEMLDTSIGIELVATILGRIEYGVFS